jgi:hypothetical protein
MIQDIGLFLAGMLVGSMNSIAGGGMLFGFPIMLAAGLSPLAANVTGNLALLPGSVSSAYGYRNYLKKLHKRYLLLLIPCLVGGTIGAFILRMTPSSKFEGMVPGLIFFAVLLFAFQPYLHFHLQKHIRSRSRALRPLALIAMALLPVAIYGGYFGAGFGFIMLAFLGFTKLKDVHKMNGLKNLASASISFVSLLVLLTTGLVNWEVGLVMGAGSLTGGYYGSILSQKVSSHTVRVFVIVIGFSTAAYLAF